jgi:hypothetical protein
MGNSGVAERLAFLKDSDPWSYAYKYILWFGNCGRGPKHIICWTLKQNTGDQEDWKYIVFIKG